MTESTILVVDPNPDQRIILTSLLQDHGYRVRETADPAEALRLVTAEPPDLILGEHPVHFEDHDASLCEVLLRDPTTAGIPFLALTARAMPDEVAAARASHAAGVLLKPVTLPRLLAAVEAVLDGHSIQHGGRRPNRQPAPSTSEDGD